MKDFLQGFVVAFSMYSKIPMPQIEWTKKNMKYCICFFPLIGLVIGAAMCGWLWMAGNAQWGILFRTALLIVIPVAVTGGIHLDGFLDTSDALSSYKSQEEKLLILKDSHAGAFAIIMGIVYFVLAFGIFSEITLEKMEVLGLGFVLSRALSGLGLVTLKKAKNTGLLYTFADAAANKRVAVVMALYLVVTAGVMIWMNPIYGSSCVLMALLAFWAYRQMAYSKFGGITGDLAGWFVQTAELMMAFVLAVM